MHQDNSTEVSSQALNGARKKCPKDSSNKSKLNGSSHKADVIYKDCSNHTKDNNEQERLLVLKEKAKTGYGDNIKASILGPLMGRQLLFLLQLKPGLQSALVLLG